MNLGTGAQLFHWVDTIAGVAGPQGADFGVDAYTKIRIIPL